MSDSRYSRRTDTGSYSRRRWGSTDRDTITSDNDSLVYPSSSASQQRHRNRTVAVVPEDPPRPLDLDNVPTRTAINRTTSRWTQNVADETGSTTPRRRPFSSSTTDYSSGAPGSYYATRALQGRERDDSSDLSRTRAEADRRDRERRERELRDSERRESERQDREDADTRWRTTQVVTVTRLRSEPTLVRRSTESYYSRRERDMGTIDEIKDDDKRSCVWKEYHAERGVNKTPRNSETGRRNL
ncbi:hypothetical protein B0T26DRAFT_675593 [Lasiosphaeria miniovina]|uniref:Uncharacterized protein n=1 Tax=Lasiosphaeria miniovina TaxID=1954250 RepID=A0AA40DY31_9PEZI|nr:uncharacterized protein B0T26DRAFT_675593 [Lasiosphaeria miniovina]KAK0717261.1 hypothetical protein B0T26DRAFT_675593 [Lasiosphaeria miniovina]